MEIENIFILKDIDETFHSIFLKFIDMARLKKRNPKSNKIGEEGAITIKLSKSIAMQVIFFVISLKPIKTLFLVFKNSL